MGLWIMEVPGWQPAPLNKLIGGHWGKAAKLKGHDKDILRNAILAYGVPKATGKRRVSLRFILEKKQRAFDPDAAWKSCLDALVFHGVLVDDNRQGVVQGPVRFNRADDGEGKVTFITIEDVD